MSFFGLFMLTFAVLAGLLHFAGLDFLTTVSGAASAICNVGPALVTLSARPAISRPAGQCEMNLAAGMLLGRLELFTVPVLFAPWFWRG